MTEPVPSRDHALAQEASSGGSDGGSGGGGESTGTVVVAGLANLGIAIAKLVGGVISHSSAMLSEAAHSLADTITEVLLFVALERGTGPPDARHPVGHGRETYFWALLACLRAEIAGLPQVEGVPVLLTSVIGPGQLAVMAEVDFADTATVADVERASDEAERRLVARHAGVRFVFLDPTPGDGRARAEVHRPE